MVSYKRLELLGVAMLAGVGFMVNTSFAAEKKMSYNEVSTTQAATVNTIGKMNPNAIKAASKISPKALNAMSKMDAKTLATVSSLSKNGGLTAVTKNAKTIQALSAAKAARNKAVAGTTQNAAY